MDQSSSGGQRGRSNKNRSSSGGNRNQNRNRSGGERRSSRSRRPEPEPTFMQKVLGVFGFGKKKTESTPSGDRSSSRSSSSSSSKPRERKPAQKVEVTSGRLYVGNLNYDTTGDDLSDHFGEAGSVSSAEVVSNPHNNRSKGFGFVEMGSIDDAKKAVEMFDGKELAGRQLIVNGAKADKRSSDRPSRDSDSGEERRPRRDSGDRPRRDDSRRDDSRRDDDGPRREGRSRRSEERRGSSSPQDFKKKDVEVVSSPELNIENVNPKLVEDDLVDVFRGIGTMSACAISKDGEGKATSAAVTMSSVAEAQRVLEILDGKTYMGKSLKISGSKGGGGESAAAAPVEAEAAVEAEEPKVEAETEAEEPKVEVEAEEPKVEAEAETEEPKVEAEEAPAEDGGEEE